MNRRRFIFAAVSTIAVLLPVEVIAGNAKKTLAKRAWKRLWSRDITRDNATATKRLDNSRRVWRYTTRDEANKAATEGLKANRHMTSRTNPGRPLSATSAKDRYGLPKKPEVRMMLEIPKNHPIRKNKVIGGNPGYGEITSPKGLPPSAVKNYIHLTD